MEKVFEDEFMEAQSRIVSLCLEVLENNNIIAEKVYIYLYQNEFENYINAFFEQGNKICEIDEHISEESMDEFFELGVEDIDNIIDVCNVYESECPNVFKLIYQLESKKFDADYSYEDYVLIMV